MEKNFKSAEELRDVINPKKTGLKTFKLFLGRAVKIILGFWVIFSVGYVARDQWMRFQNRQLTTAYQIGIANAVRTLMQSAESCQPISLIDGEKKTELIKLDCDNRAGERLEQQDNFSEIQPE